jgi:molybdate transport system substrate-binding protein
LRRTPPIPGPAPLVLALLLLAGCGGADGSRPRTLLVSAASSLDPAFREIANRFEARTGRAVDLNFGSSGQLAQQIERGAPVDVFASADVEHVDGLERAGALVPGSVRLYARGRLVVYVPAGGAALIRRFEDLARPEVERVAIANPEHAPYGIAAREALTATGLREVLAPRLVTGENARQALEYARTGTVDAALGPYSLAAGGGDGRILDVPPELYRPVDHAIAVVAGTRERAAARDFVDYVLSAEGRALLARHGFDPPAAEERP